MEALATHKNAHISARKARLYRQILKGLPVALASSQLRFLPGKAPRLIQAVLQSAVANAKNNLELEEQKLVVSDVVINDGFVLKRYRPASRGMAHPILKRTAHITVVVEQRAVAAKRRKRRAAVETVEAPDAVPPPAHPPESDTIAADKTPGQGQHPEPVSTRSRGSKQSEVAMQKMRMLQQGGDRHKSHRRKSTRGKSA